MTEKKYDVLTEMYNECVAFMEEKKDFNVFIENGEEPKQISFLYIEKADCYLVANVKAYKRFSEGLTTESGKYTPILQKYFSGLFKVLNVQEININ